MQPVAYRLLADLVVVVHFAYVAFVVVGLFAILFGMLWHWSWVRNFWFRAIHLLMIGVVVLESLFGVSCPLTDLETRLRGLAGNTPYDGTFIGWLIGTILFWNLPDGVFTATYCLFGLSVLCIWLAAPPRWPWKSS